MYIMPLVNKAGEVKNIHATPRTTQKDHILDSHRRWITQLMVLDKCPTHMGKNKVRALCLMPK